MENRTTARKEFRISRNPFLPLAERLCGALKLDQQKGKLANEIRALGRGQKNCVHAYHVRKLADLMLLCTLAAMLLIALIVLEAGKDRSVTDGVLKRPGYGESGSDQSLNLKISGVEESECVDVHLEARTYTEEQAKALIDAAETEFLERLPGSNQSPDEIRYPLELPEKLQNGAVKAEYFISPPGIIEEDGTIIGNPGKEGELIMIRASLTCQKEERTVECPVMVFPPILSEKAQLKKDIRDAVEQAQTEDLTDTQIYLPKQVNGHNLSWSYPKSSGFRVLVLLLLILPIVFWVRSDSQIHEKAQERSRQLDLDYSEVLWKLTMLLSAGLTIRGAFTRITAQYSAEYRQKRYVYEEMLLTLREMNSGVAEASAYENFGRRCELPSYIKLGSLLSQNLKKGSKGLTAMLEHEAMMSMEQHKMAVKKIGERASVKMLLPMIMMFGVVLIILMVPAFLAM